MIPSVAMRCDVSDLKQILHRRAQSRSMIGHTMKQDDSITVSIGSAQSNALCTSSH